MAWSLMLVGMVTVFIVLMLVVLSGRALTYFINKYLPEEAQSAAGGGAAATIEGSKVAVIEAAVNLVTRGKGKVVKIEKRGKN